MRERTTNICYTTIYSRSYFYYLIFMSRESKQEKKNPAAVALGRLGGLKGGPARAKKLSAKRRSELARRAVMARWNKRK
ncbi:MAG: hypothetical protein ACLP2Y_05190 [Limisphaerales bacterium]